jgi:hypothetical protein
VNFADLPPSKQWAALKYKGETIAGVWFKPEGEPFALTFRIPRESFQIPGMGPQLTPENLLKAVTLTNEEVDSWRQGDASHSGMEGSNPELKTPLPPPPPDVSHRELFVRLKPPPGAEVPKGSGGPAIPLAKWQDLETRWRAIVGLEVAMDSLRISMEGLRAEMEAAAKRTLTTEEKVHALRADVAQWTKAKSRLHHVLPKVKEFIHRSVWAMGLPERKKLEEVYKDHIRPQVPFPELDQVQGQLDNMLKDRQVLSGHGVTVFQEGKGLAAEVAGALRTLQSNAAAKATDKKREARKKGKYT